MWKAHVSTGPGLLRTAMLLPGASGPAGKVGPWHQPIPAPWPQRGISHPSKGSTCPSRGINMGDRAKARASAHHAAVSATLPTQLLPPARQEGGMWVPGLAPQHTPCPAKMRLFAQWVNLSAMLCPSYIRKREPATAEPLLPIVPCPKCSAGAQASLESLWRSPRTGRSPSSASAPPLAWPRT